MAGGRFLNRNAASTGLIGELCVVNVVRVLLLLQLFPLLGLLFDQVTDDTFGSSLLLFAAFKGKKMFRKRSARRVFGQLTFAAFGFESVGQRAFQLVTVGRALASVHQALEVVVEQAIGLQDLIQVDAIVLCGVAGRLSVDDSDKGADDKDQEFHV